MKDIRPALRNLLLSDATISGLVGGTRVHFMLMPQEKITPAIVFHEIFDASDNHMLGDSGLHQTSMQIDALATTGDYSTALAGAVHDLLSGFRGLVVYGSNSPQDSFQFQGIFHTGGRNLYDEPTKFYQMQRDYRIFYADR